MDKLIHFVTTIGPFFFVALLLVIVIIDSII